MSRIIGPHELQCALQLKLNINTRAHGPAGAVTGPGRSGALAATLASYILGVPFIPFGQPCPPSCWPLLIVDTASKTGRTLRRAVRRYEKQGCVGVRAVYAFKEPPRVTFWYEHPAMAHAPGETPHLRGHAGRAARLLPKPEPARRLRADD